MTSGERYTVIADLIAEGLYQSPEYIDPVRMPGDPDSDSEVERKKKYRKELKKKAMKGEFDLEDTDGHCRTCTCSKRPWLYENEAKRQAKLEQ